MALKFKLSGNNIYTDGFVEFVSHNLELPQDNFTLEVLDEDNVVARITPTKETPASDITDFIMEMVELGEAEDYGIKEISECLE